MENSGIINTYLIVLISLLATAAFAGPNEADLISRGVEAFCDESVIEGVGLMNMNLTPELISLMISNREDIYSLGSSTLIGPWALSWLPDERLRRRVLDEEFGLTYEAAQKMMAIKAPALTSIEKVDISNSIQKIFSSNESEQKEYGLLDNAVGRAAACALVGFDTALNCQKGISRIRQITSQRDLYSMPAENSEVLTDERYREGLRLAALKLADKINKGGKTQGDLFGDIKDSFVSTGIAPEKADDMTWTVMAAISASGPNYSNRASGFGSRESNLQTKVAMSLIAQSIPLLNQRSRGNDRFYSYPAGLKTSCDNGKSYHFWMSAYLARRLSTEMSDPKAAAAAVFTVEKGYQFLSRTAGRDPERAFTVDTFDGFNNIMRLDLTYSSAGAAFGSCLSGNCSSALNIDYGVKKIVAESKITPTISRSEAVDLVHSHVFQAFKKWSERFAPDSVFPIYNP